MCSILSFGTGCCKSNNTCGHCTSLSCN
jgi:hypothetical protein